MDGVFILGTDTNVGKTAIAAGLLKLIYGTHKVAYWKPVQTNTLVSNDTDEVRILAPLPKENFLEPKYRFAEPLSPRMAARKWGKQIEVEEIAREAETQTKTGTFLLVEGAGGLLLPLNEQHTQADLIKRLKFPVLLVGTDKVGVINQALLTLNACKDEKITVLGMVMTRSNGLFGNSESISHFGKVEILAEFAPTEDVRTLVAQVGANTRLREAFNVSALPH